MAATLIQSNPDLINGVDSPEKKEMIADKLTDFEAKEASIIHGLYSQHFKPKHDSLVNDPNKIEFSNENTQPRDTPQQSPSNPDRTSLMGGTLSGQDQSTILSPYLLDGSIKKINVT